MKITIANEFTNTIQEVEENETILVTVNVSFQQKMYAKHLKERVLKSQEDYLEFNDMPTDTNKFETETLFYFMFEQMLNFVADELDIDEEEKNDLIKSLTANEQSEMLNTISHRINRENTIKIERVPSNYTMSLCHCAGCYDSKNETADKLDFSKDVLLTD